jgi:hypothetical protein
VSCSRWIGSALPAGLRVRTTYIDARTSVSSEVLSGKLGLRVEGVERVLGEGEVLVAPAGYAHAGWNAGDDEVHALVDFRPALRTETAFETLAGLAVDGKTNGAGAPRTRCGWLWCCASMRMRFTSSGRHSSSRR